VKKSSTSQLARLSGPVLITGHTGFKGTWMTLFLESLGVETIGVALPAEKDSLYTRLARQGVISEEFIDIRDFENIKKLIKKHEPSAIFHLAAQPIVLESYKSPRETFEINTMGTVNILEAAFEVDSVRSIGIVTTDKVYKNLSHGRKFTEEDVLGGKDPYSASKVGAESAVSAWQHISAIQGGPNIISLRAGNVIGGGDFSPNRLIPDLVRGIINGSDVEIRNPLSTRPWQHVLDPICGYISAVERNLTNNDVPAFNFGPTEPSISVSEVTKIFSREIENDAKVVLSESAPEQASEILNLDLDSSLAREVLGWQPVFNQEQAIVSTAKWWKQVIKNPRSINSAVQEDLETFRP